MHLYVSEVHMIGQFVKPMLAKSLKDEPSAETSPAFVAEPKFDGIRLQLHVEGGRTCRAFSRTGRDVLGDKGMAFLRDVDWPAQRLILDAEAYSGSGANLAAPTVMSARAQDLGDVRVAIFDLLLLAEDRAMDRELVVRRAMLEVLFSGWGHARIALIPQTPDAAALWQAWVVELGGEGIMLKRRNSQWVAGWRSPDWLKKKVEVTVDVVITGVTTKATWNRAGYRGGEAALTYGYWSQAKGEFVTVGQGVRFGKKVELQEMIGRVAEVRCAGVMPSGAVRHGQFVRFRDDKLAEECVKEAA